MECREEKSARTYRHGVTDAHRKDSVLRELAQEETEGSVARPPSTESSVTDTRPIGQPDSATSARTNYIQPTYECPIWQELRNCQASQEALLLSHGPLFLPVAFVKTTLPHTSVAGTFVRKNGNRRLILRREDGGALPSGIYPRLILAHITTLAVRSRRHEICLGPSMRRFFLRIGVNHASGRVIAGEQCNRLAAFTFAYVPTELGGQVTTESLVDRITMDRGRGVFILLTDAFFQLTRSAVPLDPDLLGYAGTSPLRVDLYAWLTYRAATLDAPTVIPWHALAAQFGADYSRLRDFRRRLLSALEALRVRWPDIDATPEPNGLRLNPFSPSIQAWAGQRLGADDMGRSSRRPSRRARWSTLVAPSASRPEPGPAEPAARRGRGCARPA